MLKANAAVDVTGVMELLLDKIEQINSGEWVEGPVREFHRFFLQETSDHFDAMQRGGPNRGVSWPDYSPKTIGKYPPGRKRPRGFRGRPHLHGERYAPNSPLLHDTEMLRAAAGRSFITLSPIEVEFATEDIPYAAAHNDGARKGAWTLPQRAFQFFTDVDEDVLSELTRRWLES